MPTSKTYDLELCETASRLYVNVEVAMAKLAREDLVHQDPGTGGVRLGALRGEMLSTPEALEGGRLILGDLLGASA
jgi:hypothetical protein